LKGIKTVNETRNTLFQRAAIVNELHPMVVDSVGDLALLHQ